MKRLQTLLIGLMMAPMMMSCGDKTSDPLEKYDGIKGQPAGERVEKPTVQEVVNPDLFLLEISGPNEVNNVNFIEAVPSQVRIRVTPKDPKIISYSISLADFELTDRPVLEQTGQSNVFTLRWTPPPGTIHPGQNGRPLKATFLLTVAEASHANLVGVAVTNHQIIHVHRDNTPPVILGKSDLSKGVEEGKEIPFTIDVEDPASATNPRLPDVVIRSYVHANTEAYRADGARYLIRNDKVANNPERISNTKWRFHYILSIDRLPLDRDRVGNEIPSASSVEMCFNMQAVSATGTYSILDMVCTVARYAAQPPIITMLDPQVTTVSAGVEQTMTLKVTTPHPASVVNLKNSANISASLGNKPTIACVSDDAEKKNSMTCTIKWTPACVQKETSKKVTFTATAQLDSKSKDSSLTQTFIVMPDAQACPAPQTTSTKGKK